MSQYPPQGQQYSPDQPPWQRQQSQSLPPSQPSGQWRQPGMFPPQQQPMQPGMYPPPQQPMPSGIYPPPSMQPGMYPPQQQQQPMPSGIYPPQQQHQPMQPRMFPPPQAPKKKSRLSLWIILGGIVVLLLAGGAIVAAVNSGANSDATVVATQVVATTTTVQSQPTTATTAITASTKNQHFKVGQVVKVNATWQVTINSVKTVNGNDFSTPTVGDTYFIVDVTLKNLSGQVQNVSSALNFSLQDATGQKYTETILVGETPPDGKVEASSLLHGQLTYEVPISQTSFTFNFEPDLVAGNQTVWDLQK